jgi:prepilin-type N-terminal cleavage/methylation domain-containing protein
MPGLRRQPRSERAFTLIELLVVMIIIAILMAIAVPTFLAQKSTASKTKALENIQHVSNAVEACAAAGDGTYGRCLEHAELIKYEKSLKDILDVWGGGPRTAGEFDIDAIDGGTVVKAPIAGRAYQGYIVSTWVKDGNERIWYSLAHFDDGTVGKWCGRGDTGTAAPSGSAPAHGASVAGSRVCTTGSWS